MWTNHSVWLMGKSAMAQTGKIAKGQITEGLKF